MKPGYCTQAMRKAALAGILSLCSLLFVAGCKGKSEAPPPQPPQVSVVTVVSADVPVSLEYVAQTQSSHLVNIQARVSGFLDKRLYTEGAIVKQGQVLFQMDPKPFETQLAQAEAALAQAEAARETARLNLERTQPLAAQTAMSQKDLDDATGRYQSTCASVEQAKAQAEGARLNLSYTTITSPVTGISSSAKQSDGTYISSQNSLLTTVAALSPMWVNFSLSENEVQSFRDQVARGRLRTPTQGKFILEIIFVDGSIYAHTGTITFAEPSFNPQTGTFLVRGSVENPDGILRPNQYVRVRLHGAVRPHAIRIPQRAVQQGSKGHFVWVVGTDGKAEERPVTVGEWQGDDWFISEGLRAGDRVVLDGALLLRPGIAVNAKPLETSPETGRGQAAPGAGAAPEAAGAGR
jgi:membrane fusion protein, multidrug efflux system